MKTRAIALTSAIALSAVMAAPVLATQAASIRYAPCWTLMIGFDAPVPFPWDGLFINQGPLGWIANDGAKPGRRGPVTVLHANADWSRRHLELDRESVVAILLEAFASIVGRPLPAVVWSRAHRWLYSLADNPLDTDCLWDADLGIGACGDWCRGARIEGAWLSGEALAGRILADTAR